MRHRIVIFVAALALTLGVAASVHAKDTGTVMRLDPQAGVVMLEGGRMYRSRRAPCFPLTTVLPRSRRFNRVCACRSKTARP